MTDVTLSEDVTERIEARIEQTDFEDVDEYADFVLSQVLTQVERNTDDTQPGASRESVEDRLQSLGYLEE